jgi:predicted RNase H-like HicB family nuclease
MSKGKTLEQNKKTFTAYVEYDSETGLYVGIVPGVPGAHTQGATLDELHKNLEEVIQLCLEEQTDINIKPPKFIGLQQIEVTV